LWHGILVGFRIETASRNEVILLFEADNLQKAKEFAGSAHLRERMREAGVVDKPDIYFLN
jgi:hypothetical protein